MANVQIFIPTYNRSGKLKKAISSALNQTYKDISVVVIDNASSDNTFDVVNNIIKFDSRVKYYRNAINIGMIGNFNLIRYYVDSNYFCFLCDDDVYNNNFIDCAIQSFLLYPEIVAAAYNAPVRENGVILCSQLDGWNEGVYKPKDGIGLKYCFDGKHPIITNCLFRSSFKDEFVFENDLGAASDVYILWKLFSLYNVFVSKVVSGYWDRHRQSAALNVSLVDSIRINILLRDRYSGFLIKYDLSVEKNAYFHKSNYYIQRILTSCCSKDQLISITKDDVIDRYFGGRAKYLILLMFVIPFFSVKRDMVELLRKLYRKYLKNNIKNIITR